MKKVAALDFTLLFPFAQSSLANYCLLLRPLFIWGAVCKKIISDKFVTVFPYLEKKLKLPEHLLTNKAQNLSDDV